MLPRFVLALLLALPFSITTLIPALQANQSPILTISMLANVDGVLQVFFDNGGGFSEAQSAHVPLRRSTAAIDYRLRMPHGIYQALRIDPGTSAGRYEIEAITVASELGEPVASVPLTEVHAAHALAERRRDESRLIVDAPPGAVDPQLLYRPAAPIVVLPGSRPLGPRVWLALGYVGAALLLVFGAERVLAPLASPFLRVFGAIAAWVDVNRSVAVLVVATLATFLATYPILLFDRSFVSPNNGGTLMLYNQAPFVPGGDDFELEDTRGADVGAVMWAFVPYSKVQRDALAQGEFPLWNRHNGSGRTLWAQGMSFLFDPLHWLTFVSPDLAAGWDLKFVAHRLVFAWGTGTAVLVASGAIAPALLAAVWAPFISVFVYRFNHPAAFVVTYMPWILVGWFLISRSTDRRRAARGALLVAIASALTLLASPPKEAAVALAVTEAMGLLAVLLESRSWHALRVHLALACAAGVAFLLITAPHWLIFLDTLSVSLTAYEVDSFTLASAPHAWGFVLGPLTPGGLFIGVGLLLLPMAASIVLAPRAIFQHRSLLAMAAGAALLLSLAFGIVPTEWMMRVPLLPRVHHLFDVALTAATVFTIIVMAVGLESMRMASPIRAWLAATLASVFLCGVVLHLVWTASVHQIQTWAVLGVGLPAVALPIVVAAVRQAPTAVMPVLASVGAVAALLLPGGLHLETGLGPLDHLLLQPRPRVALEANSAAVDAIRRAVSEPVRVGGLSMNLLPGTQALYDLEGIGGPDALQMPEYEELLDAAGVERTWRWLTGISTSNLDAVSPLLDLMNVGFLLGHSSEVGTITEPMREPDVLSASRRPTAWPRAYFVDAVSTYTDVSDFVRQLRANGRPFAAVQASDPAAVEATRTLVGSDAQAIAADEYVMTANTTRFRLRTPGPGIAILSETFLSHDFVATINGVPASYFRVNHAFKGVRLPGAGEWVVKFEYRPARWRLSWVAAACGGLILLVLGLMSVYPSRVNRRIPSVGAAA